MVGEGAGNRRKNAFECTGQIDLVLGDNKSWIRCQVGIEGQDHIEPVPGMTKVGLGVQCLKCT
jgi:hypothetical protein